MNRIQLSICLLLIGFTLPVMPQSEFVHVIQLDQWPAIENGTNVLSLPQISAIVRRFAEDENVRIEIRYPGGDAGQQWAESCGRWLVAFGIPGSALELLPGSGAGDRLVIALIDRR